MWTDRGRGEAASQGDRPDAAALRHARPGRRPDRAVRRARRDADVPAGPRSVRPRPPRRDRLGGGPTATVRRMRVAVLSDIHGVLPALEALSALGEQALWVRGNADRELVTLSRGGTTSIPDPVAPWAAAQLRPDQVALLDALPLAVTLDLDGLGRTVFCHATPRDDEEVVLVDSRLERWDEVFSTLDESVSTVVCGHTHMPFVRLADR